MLGGSIDAELSAAHGEAVVARCGRPHHRSRCAGPSLSECPRRSFPAEVANLVSNDAREADYAGTLFESLGVAKARLTMERRSRNTQENAEFSKAMVEPKSGERWLLVTSAFHMPRSVGLFRKAGFAVEPYPVDWRVGGRSDLLTFSSMAIEGLGRTDIALREWMGLIAYRATGKIDELLPGPTKRSETQRNRARIGAGARQPRRFGSYAMQQQTPPEQFDLPGMVADLNNLLRLKTTVIGMKMFARVEEMAAIPKIRRPTAVHTTDQIVSMASRLGWTVGITADDLVGAQCRAVIGLAPQDEKWLAGQNYVGVWHGTAEDARKRQEALDVVPFGQYQALAVSPLASGRLNPPDICLVYATPGQMIILINGLQYTGYKKFEWGVVGETACADSWGRALKTGEPSLSLPCFAERRYGGVPDEEMLMALPPAHLAKAIVGMKQLAKNGLRYPIAPYGIQNDVRAGMGVSYAKT